MNRGIDTLSDPVCKRERKLSWKIRTTRSKQAIATTLKLSYYLAIYVLSLCAGESSSASTPKKEEKAKCVSELTVLCFHPNYSQSFLHTNQIKGNDSCSDFRSSLRSSCSASTSLLLFCMFVLNSLLPSNFQVSQLLYTHTHTYAGAMCKKWIHHHWNYLKTKTIKHPLIHTRARAHPCSYSELEVWSESFWRIFALFLCFIIRSEGTPVLMCDVCVCVWLLL